MSGSAQRVWRCSEASAQPSVQKIAAMTLYDGRVGETAFGRRVSGREAAIVTLKRLGKDAEGAFPALSFRWSPELPVLERNGLVRALLVETSGSS